MVLLHIIAIFFTGLCVLYSDEQGLMWMLGKKQLLEHDRVAFLHTAISLGLPLIILTGGLLALPSLSYYLHNITFLIKMGFVGALIVNGFFIGSIATKATTHTFTSLTPAQRLPLLVSGTVSVLAWSGALIAGFLLGG